jgi:hypothetical protein
LWSNRTMLVKTSSKAKNSFGILTIIFFCSAQPKN